MSPRPDRVIQRVITRSAVSSARLKVPCGELAVIWDLAVAISVDSWRDIMVLELGLGLLKRREQFGHRSGSGAAIGRLAGSLACGPGAGVAWSRRRNRTAW